MAGNDPALSYFTVLQILCSRYGHWLKGALRVKANPHQ